MKVHALGSWEQVPSSPSTSSSFSSSSANDPKRLRPLAPRLTSAAVSTAVATEISAPPKLRKSFSSPMTAKCASIDLDVSLIQMQSGGTRWNPTPEQIKLLEALYQGGMRTPNPVQIERITMELGKYGRIEGKNVFYWFQNHKARERQKQKRSELLALAASAAPLPHPKVQLQKEEIKEFHGGSCKRKCRSWGSLELAVEEEGPGDRTLELFPLHPERKQM
ncbi:unnamed protein product [Musa textilis]